MPLAGVVLLDLGQTDAQELVPFVRRQAVECLIRAGEMWCQGNAERTQQLRAVEAGGDDALLDLRRDRLAVHDSGEGEEVEGVVGRHRDGLVRAFDMDVGHGKRHQHGDVLVRLVEEAVADADLLGGDRKVFGNHLDGVVADEDEPAGGELGGGIVGEGGNGHNGRNGKRKR